MDNLTQEEIEFIKSLSHEMKTQDNRGTAQPFALIIGQKDRQLTDYKQATRKAISWNESDYDSLEDFTEALEEYYRGDKYEHSAIRYIYDTCSDIDDLRRHECEINNLLSENMHVYGYQIVNDYSPNLYGGNFFLTEKSAKQYIESNRHNLRDPFTYGIHLCRNPEMEKLYEIIHKLAEVL